MVRSERRGPIWRQGELGSKRGAGRGSWIVAGTVLLFTLALVSLTACTSNAETGSSTTANAAPTAQAGTQTGAPTGMAGGTAPTGTDGQRMTPPAQPPTTTESASTSSTASASTTTTVPASTATTPATATASPTSTTTLPDGRYGDGVHRVGYSYDIDPGLYSGTVVGDKGHWEISSDAAGVKFVAGGDPVGPFYVKIKSGQYLRLNGVVVEKADSEAADPLLTSSITDGTYRVGYDIAAGWYDGTVDGTLGYWEISSDANGTSLVANEYPRGPFTLKVLSGQYLTLRGVTVTQ